jgi:hypothetical protein
MSKNKNVCVRYLIIHSREKRIRHRHRFPTLEDLKGEPEDQRVFIGNKEGSRLPEI